VAARIDGDAGNLAEVHISGKLQEVGVGVELDLGHGTIACALCPNRGGDACQQQDAPNDAVCSSHAVAVRARYAEESFRYSSHTTTTNNRAWMASSSRSCSILNTTCAPVQNTINQRPQRRPLSRRVAPRT